MADNVEIKNLQIEITADASQAEREIKNLANTLKNAGKGKVASGLTEGARDLGEIASEGGKVRRSMDEVSSSIRKVAERLSTIRSLGNVAMGKLVGLTANVAKGFAKLGGSALKGFANSITGIVGKITTAFAAIKRIAFYRLIRSAIKGITTAIREGVKSLIEWDRAWGNNTSYAAKTADEIVSKWTEVKKAFGAAAMPLIQILQPALMAVMQTAINVVNAINQIFRIFQGYSTYMKATAGIIEDTADKAGKAAKELKRVLFGFDELNVLPSPNNGGGGADAGASNPFDFVETDIELPFQFDKDSGKTLGKQLAEMLNEAIGMFDADGFAKRVSTKLNNAIANIRDFLTTLDFMSIGNKVGELISSAFRNIDWAGLGTIVGEWFFALPRLIIGFINELDFRAVGTALKDFIKSALRSITGFFTNTDWELLGYNIVNGIINFIKGLDPLDVALSLWNFIKSVLKAAWGLIKGAGSALFGEDTPTYTPGTRTTTTVFGETIEVPVVYEVDEPSVKTTKTETQRLTKELKEETTFSVTPTYNKKEEKAVKQSTRPFLKWLDDAWLKISKNNPYSIYYDGYNEDPFEEIRQEYLKEKGYIEKHPVIPETDLNPFKRSIADTGSWLKDPNNTLVPNVKDPTVDTHLFTEEVGRVKRWLGEDGQLLKVRTKDPSINVTPVKDKVDETKTWLNKDENTLTPRVKNPSINTGEVENTVGKTTAWLASNPLVIHSILSGSGLGGQLTEIMRQLQDQLNKNPLTTPNVIAAASHYQKYGVNPFYDPYGFYADGGTPEIGSLFWAGEAGAEIVANGRSGGTGVMNVDQMQQAVASGNVEVVNALYAVANMLGAEIRNKDNNVYLDGDKIGQSVSRYQTNQARRGVQGVVYG